VVFHSHYKHKKKNNKQLNCEFKKNKDKKKNVKESTRKPKNIHENIKETLLKIGLFYNHPAITLNNCSGILG